VDGSLPSDEEKLSHLVTRRVRDEEESPDPENEEKNEQEDENHHLHGRVVYNPTSSSLFLRSEDFLEILEGRTSFALVLQYRGVLKRSENLLRESAEPGPMDARRESKRASG